MLCSDPLSDREETEIIEGEVVEIQIDRPATGTVSLPRVWATPRREGCTEVRIPWTVPLQIGASACLQ